MRIGIMLRHLDQHGGGVRVYTENLLRELFALESEHEFLLLYRNPELLGRYAGVPGVRELALPARATLQWDQLTVRRVAARERLDLLFNPKYSIPLAAPCKSVWVCHGLDWFVAPEWSRWQDRLSHRLLVPLYARRAARILAVSKTTERHLAEYLGVGPARVTTVYHGVDEDFRQPVAPEVARATREKHGLPERFVLYCGQIYPPKNFGRLLRAFAKVGPEQGVHLVVAGTHTWLAGAELALVDELGLEPWVVRTGWVERTELPAFYALADALALPSLYESFGLPLVEAMAAGCPVLTADRHAPAELVGDAGVLVDPESVDAIAEGLRRILCEPALRERIVDAGRVRARDFSWRSCARETLAALEETAASD